MGPTKPQPLSYAPPPQRKKRVPLLYLWIVLGLGTVLSTAVFVESFRASRAERAARAAWQQQQQLRLLSRAATPADRIEKSH